jgi:flagellar biogenesis protein FliO
MKSQIVGSLAPASDVLPEMSSMFNGSTLALLAFFYIGLVALHFIVQRRNVRRSCKQNPLAIVGELALGRRERILEVSTATGNVIVVVSDKGVAITESGSGARNSSRFQEVLNETQRRAA